MAARSAGAPEVTEPAMKRLAAGCQAPGTRHRDTTGQTDVRSGPLLSEWLILFQEFLLDTADCATQERRHSEVPLSRRRQADSHMVLFRITHWQEMEMPDEVNIDDLLDLETDEQRRSTLQIMLSSGSGSTEDFIRDLLFKLKGLQKQTLLKNGLEISQEEAIQEHA